MWILYVHIIGAIATLFGSVAVSSYNNSTIDADDTLGLIVLSLTAWPLLILFYSAETLGAVLREKKEKKILFEKEEKARLNEADRLL